MEILIIRNGLGKSVAIDKKVRDLPTMLQKQVQEALSIIPDAIRIILNQEEVFIEINGGIQPLTYFQKKIAKKIDKIIKLLDWYLKPHWDYIGTPGALGETIHCVECYFHHVPGDTLYCLNSKCPSHKKWKKVLGLAYKAPKTRMNNV